MTETEEVISGKITRNHAYGTHPRQIMDLAVPEKADARTPWVLLIHGGGWKMGNKRWMDGIQKMLYRKGIASANINYRLAGNDVDYRKQLKDVAAAIAQMQTIMARFGNRGKYFLLGESAGAHLSMLYGYQHPEAVAGIVSLSGPTDFYTETYRSNKFFRKARNTIEAITGGNYEAPGDASIFEEASPLTHITPVPTLLFQGTRDRVVDASQALTLADALKQKGYPHKLILMEGAGHVPRLLPWKRPAIYREILSWITQNAS